MKNLFIFIALSVLFSCAKKEDTDIKKGIEGADIKKVVSEAYPNVNIENIKKIDENFHEIIINNQIYYATNDGKYLIVGNVIDLDTKESITENTKMKQRIAVIASIDPNNMIIYKPQKSNHIMTVFTDSSCPYCQKLHNEIPDLLENNVEVRYVLFSRNGNTVDAYQQLLSAWCSEDRVSSVEDLFQGELLDESNGCDNPLDKNFEYAGILSVEGTPTIFLEDGRIIPGYQNYKKILAFINKAN